MISTIFQRCVLPGLLILSSCNNTSTAKIHDEIFAVAINYFAWDTSLSQDPPTKIDLPQKAVDEILLDTLTKDPNILRSQALLHCYGDVAFEKSVPTENCIESLSKAAKYGDATSKVNLAIFQKGNIEKSMFEDFAIDGNAFAIIAMYDLAENSYEC